MGTFHVCLRSRRCAVVLGLLGAGCQPVERPSVLGKYWDLVSSVTAETSHPVLNPDGTARYCVRFTQDSVVEYVNATERTIVDVAQHSGDVIMSYRFAQAKDSLFFGGTRFRIARLTQDTLILTADRRGFPHRRIYKAARQQRKVVRVF